MEKPYPVQAKFFIFQNVLKEVLSEKIVCGKRNNTYCFATGVFNSAQTPITDFLDLNR